VLSFAEPMERMTTPALVAKTAAYADEGEWTGALIREASTRGMAAAIEAAKHVDPEHLKRSQKMLEIIASTGRSRRMPAELLRLYDPDAHRLFYLEAGKSGQDAFIKIFDADDWPPRTPEAAVRAAPDATLAWLDAQTKSDAPRHAEIASLLRVWSQWIAYGNERTQKPAVRSMLQTLSASSTITANDDVLSALLRCAGHCRAEGLTSFASASLDSKKSAVRMAACDALGNMQNREALTRLRAAAGTLKENQEQRTLVTALGNYKESAEAGEAALRLFNQTVDTDVRRDILLVLQRARWPQQQELIRAGIENPEGGVLGAALDAIQGALPKDLQDLVVELASNAKKPWPNLVDALGHMGDRRAVTLITNWLRHEDNIAMRTKMVVALERIGGRAAKLVILELIGSETDESVMQYVLRAAGRLNVEAATKSIVELAQDTSAPSGVRAEAVWTLGHLQTSAARNCLRKLSAHPQLLLSGAVDEDSASELEQARLYVELARLKRGEADAMRSVEALYRESSPVSKLTVLVALGYLEVDHPLIRQGLRSADFPVALGAVRAAHDVDPGKYLAELKAFRDDPFMNVLLDTGLQDVSTLKYYVDEGIRKGES